MKSDAKKTKNENPLVLNAEVGLHRPDHGLAKLGEIIGTSKSILTVKWEPATQNILGERASLFTES